MLNVEVDGYHLSVDERYFGFGFSPPIDGKFNGFYCDFPMCVCMEDNYISHDAQPFAEFGALRNCKVKLLCRHHYRAIFDKVQEANSVSSKQSVLYIVSLPNRDECYSYFTTKEALFSAIADELEKSDFDDEFSIQFEKKKLEG